MKKFTSALLNSHSVDAVEFLDDISVSRRARQRSPLSDRRTDRRILRWCQHSTAIQFARKYFLIDTGFQSVVADDAAAVDARSHVVANPPAGRMQKFPIHPEWHSHCCTVSDNVDGRNLPRLIQSTASSQSRRGSAQSRKSFLTSLIVHTIVLLLLALVNTATSNGGRLAALVITSHFVDCETEKKKPWSPLKSFLMLLRVPSMNHSRSIQLRGFLTIPLKKAPLALSFPRCLHWVMFRRFLLISIRRSNY